MSSHDTDFVYMFQLGDYQHVLRPADQKSADNLKLAKQAVSHIDMARNLLMERGPFLLAEKQQKMDELISDTEEAINRVTKLLEPARIEQVSEESVRFNLKNTFVLQGDEPKAAATFGRLVTTHNKLKTVLHDLRNIEATAQLDNCEVRANTRVGETNSGEIESPRLLQAEHDTSPSQTNLDNPATWKHERRQSKQTLSSTGSSASGHASDNQHGQLSDARSPVGSQGNALMSITAASMQPLRNQALNLSSLLRPKADPDNVSDVTVERLSVIHELDGASAKITLSDKNSEQLMAASKTNTGRLMPPGNADTNPAMPNPGDQQMEREVGVSAVSIISQTSATANVSRNPRTANRMTFSDYRELNKREREKDRLSWVEDPATSPTTIPHDPASPSSTANESLMPAKEAAAPGLKTLIESPAQRAREVAKQTAHRIATALQFQSQQQNLEAPFSDKKSEVSISTEVASSQEFEPSSRTIDSRGARHEDEAQTMPPTLNSSPGPGIDQAVNSFVHLHTDLLPVSTQMLTPSRMQMSPETPTASGTTTAENMPQRMASFIEPPSKSYHVFQIDPELTRLPSLLRAGHKSRPQRPPYPISEEGSDTADPTPSDVSAGTQTQSAVERPITAPPMPHPVARQTHPPLHGFQSIHEYPHHRSFSDSSVPKIYVRPPTVPRKPVPDRNSMIAVGPKPIISKMSESDVAQRQPPPVQLQSPNDGQVSQPGASGPPSPFDFQRPSGPVMPTPSSISLNSLSVEVVSSVESSRRSSVSVEQNPQQPMFLPESKHPVNPLTLNPTYPQYSLLLPDNSHVVPPQTAVCQAQSEVLPPAQLLQQLDYRSPAFQQSRHFFDPTYNTHLEATMNSTQQLPSRFRDADQCQKPLHRPLRTSTEPVVPQTGEMYDQVQAKPRRASAQAFAAEAPLIPQLQHAPSPLPPLQYQTPYAGQQIQQSNIDRTSIIRSAPPAEVGRNEKRLPLPGGRARGGSLCHNTGGGQADKDLFGRQVFRHQSDEPPQLPPKQQATSSLENPQTYSHQQRQAPSIAPQSNNPIQPRPEQTQLWKEVPRQYLAPVREGETVASTAQDSGPLSAGQTPLSTGTVRKRSSWLVHQANKLMNQRR